MRRVGFLMKVAKNIPDMEVHYKVIAKTDLCKAMPSDGTTGP